MSDTSLVDKSFDGMMRQMRRNITELQRRLGSLAVLPLPASYHGYGLAISAVTAAAATWEPVPTVTPQVTYTPAAALEVLVTYSASITGNGTVYGMIGVGASGGITVAPDYDQNSGLQEFGSTPFALATTNTPTYGSKLLVLPGGVPTTLMMMRRRNTAAFAPAVNYTQMQVMPRRWV